MNREVVVLRGASGAGKSTYAKTRFQGKKVEICSADDFFMKEGKYVFDWRLLDRAHASCLRRFIHLLSLPTDAEVVVVDNTNTTLVEIAPYMMVAQAFEWPARVVTIDVDEKTAEKRNLHGVLIPSIEKQLSNIRKADEQWPKWWKHIREVAK